MRAIAFSVDINQPAAASTNADGDHHDRSKEMAQLPGSPEDLGRQTSLPWTPGEGGESLIQAIQALETYKKKDPSKGRYRLTPSMRLHVLTRTHRWTVVVRFKAVGNAPIMKQNFYKITAANRFQAVIQFLRKELGWKAGEPLVRGCFFAWLAPRFS